MSVAPQPASPPRGMTRGQARSIEFLIVFISVAALVLLFQPFSIQLYSIGAGLVVFAGLAFNLVPMCQPGKPASSLVKGAVIIVVIFAIVTLLALGAALLYAVSTAPA
jgi:hypothetical protein